MTLTARFVAIFAVLLAPMAGAQQKIARRIAIDPEASIRIGNLPGNTRLIGWDKDSIAVAGTVPAGASFFFGGAGRGAKMGVERDEKSGTSSGTPMLEVRVPHGARVWVRSSEGWIEVEGMTGEVDLATVSGSIKVTGSLRLLTAETLDGNLEVTGPSQLTRVRTGGGRITLSRVAGDLTVSTVGGAVQLMEAAPGSARIETVSGPVTYEGSLDRRSTLEIQTHSGDVELRLPQTVSGEFDFQSIDGTSQVALSPKAGSPKPSKGKPLFFTAGGGGAHVVVRSFKGNIRLVSRD